MAHRQASLHYIMEHVAHHVDMSIQLWQLSKAQQKHEERLPQHIFIRRFSWLWYFDTARRCELCDFFAHCWTGFDGRPAP